jgi:alpha-glucoside transport system substrate-binding protein
MAVAAAVLVVAVVAGVLSLANRPSGQETVSAGGSDEAEKPQAAPQPELPVHIEGDVSSPAFDAEIASLAETTGVEVTFESVPETELRSRVVSDDPPDIVILGSPRSLQELGESGALESLGDVLDVGALEDSMVPGLMASVQSPRGTTFGVPVSIDVKSLVWHPVPEFEDAGYWVPPTHQELVQLTNQIRSDGATPWCFGIRSGEATGWPMTDWVEEYVLRIGGPEVYDAWVRHEIPFTDPVVKQAAEAVAELLLVDGNTVAGSGPAIAELPFDESAQPLVEDPPGCYLHRQASFVTQFWPEDALPPLSEVVGFFALPPYDGGWPGRSVLGVGSVAAIVSGANARAPEVLQAMASPRWGTAWARDGVFLSPALDFDPDSYADILQGAVADVASSADAFRFDGSDQMPVTVSATFWQTMTSWVRGETSLDAALEQVEASWPD